MVLVIFIFLTISSTTLSLATGALFFVSIPCLLISKAISVSPLPFLAGAGKPFSFRKLNVKTKLIRTNPLLKICPHGSSAHLHPSWYLQRNAYRLKMRGRIWQMSESSIFQNQVNSRYIKFLLLSFQMPGLRDSFSSLSAFCLHRRKSWLKLGHAMANLKIL